MLAFFVMTFLIGLYLLIMKFRTQSRLTQYKRFLTPQTEKELHISSTQEMLEKNNSLLYYLRFFDQKITLKLLTLLGCMCILWLIERVFSLHFSSNTWALIALFLLVFFIIAPSKIIALMMESRIRKIGADIPIFVDLLAICVQSGMSIQTSIQFLENSVKEVNPYFAPFLSKLIAKIEVSGLESALLDLQQELPSKEISMMCQTLKQSLKYGSGVYDSLINLSAEIRESNLLEAEEIIGKLSAKMSVPLILFFMFPVIIVIAAPGVIRVLGGFL